MVGPLDQNREKELMGGLKNAIERGSDIMAAQRSFVNAGYEVGEVAKAAKSLAASGEVNIPGSQPKQLPAQVVKKKKPLWLWISIVVVITVVVLGAATYIGLNWEELSRNF